MRIIKQSAWFVIKFMLIAYCALGTAMFLGQRQLQYFPDTYKFNPAIFGVSGFVPLPVPVTGMGGVTSWVRPAPQADKPMIVTMHGNGGNFSHLAFRVRPWLQADYGVALVSYPGFEGNTGYPTEQAIYQSARGVLNNLQAQGVNFNKVILHGESLGTGVAIQMATEFPVAGIILESPYTSIGDVAAYHYPIFPVHWMLWDEFDSLAKINKVAAPLLIIHGDADTTVPFVLGQQLFAAAKQPKEMLVVAHVGHAGALHTEATNAAIMAFIQRIVP